MSYFYGQAIRRGTGVLIGVVLICLGLALFTARLVVFPSWYVKVAPRDGRLGSCNAYQERVYVFCSDPKKAFDFDFLSFRVETKGVGGRAEATPLITTGWWVLAPIQPETKGIVILVHGGGADRRAMLKHTAYLRNDGYHVLLIDVHNHGLSGRDGHGLSLGLWEAESIVAAAGWANEHVPDGKRLPIFALGTSLGGFAALRAMAATPLIRAVVAENPYLSAKRLLREFSALNWEPRPIKEAAMLLIGLWLGRSLDELDARQFNDRIGNRPVLVIHGLKDKIISPEQSQELFDLLKSSGKQLMLVKDGEHEYVWNVAKLEYEARVLGFLRQAARRRD